MTVDNGENDLLKHSRPRLQVTPGLSIVFTTWPIKETAVIMWCDELDFVQVAMSTSDAVCIPGFQKQEGTKFFFLLFSLPHCHLE